MVKNINQNSELTMSNTTDVTLHICGDPDAKDEALSMLLHYISLTEKETNAQIIVQMI